MSEESGVGSTRGAPVNGEIDHEVDSNYGLNCDEASNESDGELLERITSYVRRYRYEHIGMLRDASSALNGSALHKQNASQEVSCNEKENNGRETKVLGGLTAFRRLRKLAELHPDSGCPHRDIVCSSAYGEARDIVATATLTKKINIYSHREVQGEVESQHRGEPQTQVEPMTTFSSRAKLSSVCFSPEARQVASGDYEGALQIYDVEREQPIREFWEHRKRILSVARNSASNGTFASGSDDCAVKMYSHDASHSIMTLQGRANVCSVQFHEKNGNLLALGCADHRAYLHDIRHLQKPLSVCKGHCRTVSTVMFSGDSILTGGTDSKIKVWDLEGRHARTLTGHLNARSFVGMSVNNAGFVSAGGEDGRLHCFHISLPEPLVSYTFTAVPGRLQFVSDLRWKPSGFDLYASSSSGHRHLLQLST